MVDELLLVKNTYLIIICKDIFTRGNKIHSIKVTLIQNIRLLYLFRWKYFANTI